MLVVIEDTVDILRTRHVHNPEAERMAMFIPHHLCKHHRAKREKGLTKRVIGAKVGQSADMDFLRVSTPHGGKKIFGFHSHYACITDFFLFRIVHILELCVVREMPPVGIPFLSFMPLTRAYVFGGFKKSE